MKKIKLLVDAHVFDSGFQGTTSFISGLYNELVHHDELEIFLAAHNIEELRLKFTDTRFQFVILNSTNRIERLMFEFPRVIKKLQIDFAHFQYIVPPVKRCHYIVTIHDLLFKDFPEEFPLAYRRQKDFLFRRAAATADILTSVSGYSVDAIEKYYKIPRHLIIMTPNGLSKDFFEKHIKAESTKYIRSKFGIENYLLYVSRIEPRKNHELLINSFRELRLYEKGLDLVFIGQKSVPNPKLQVAIEKLPASALERIHWLEKIPFDDLIHFYNAARLFVYPSKAEGFGIPPLEAAALQTPVLCSNATAMKDFDFFKETSFDPLDENTFRLKLENALSVSPSVQQLDDISVIINEKYKWKMAADNLFQSIILHGSGQP